MPDRNPPALGVLLAGGQSSRMGGGDKCLRELAGKTLLARAIERARPQVATLVLSANGDPSRFAAYGLPVFGDPPGAGRRPLAGVLAGMEWAAANRPDLSWVASFATDIPFFPTDLVRGLFAAIEAKNADVAFARAADLVYRVFGLWPMRLVETLRRDLAPKRSGMRAHLRWLGVPFPPGAPPPFFNINTPEDLAEAERLLAAHGKPKT